MANKEGDSLIWRYFGIAFLLVILAFLVFFYLSKHQSIQASSNEEQKKIPQVRASLSYKAQGEEQEIESFHYHLTEGEENSNKLALSAQSALVADLETGKIIFAKEPHLKLFPASLTKLVTAIIAKQSYPSDKLFTISKEAASQEPNLMGLKEGDRVTTEELLWGLLINSGNDAAWALAEGDEEGPAGFVKKMNDFVTKLNLKDSHFENPSGLHHNNHYSSVYDMAVIMRYIKDKYPELLSVMGTREKALPKNNLHGNYYLSTLSSLLKNSQEIEAVKTGYTPEAGHTWIAIARKNGRLLLVGFFNSWDSTNDAKKLIDFGLYLSK